jgi:hypothetical protein
MPCSGQISLRAGPSQGKKAKVKQNTASIFFDPNFFASLLEAILDRK